MALEALAEFLARHDRFILTAHETPDADALGSELAMLVALRRAGKRAVILNADPYPANLAFLDPSGEARVLRSASELPPDLGRHALLILDVADPGNLGSVARLVLPKVAECFYVDHHEGKDWDPSRYHVESNASSTCEILYRLFDVLGIAIDVELARPLYAGVVYDTGSFAYPKTSASTFEMARRLVEAGVNPNEIYSKLFEYRTVSFLRLQARVLATLELHFHEAVAVQTMSREAILESGATYEEGQTLINLPLSAAQVRVSVFFKENLEGLRRCSLRSKGDIDVAALAAAFRGGGHRTAAGFKLDRPLEEMKAEVLQRLAIYFAPTDSR